MDKAGRIVLIIRVNDINEVMRNQGLFFLAWLGRANVHMAIDLHGVHAVDLAIKALHQLERESGFAHGSGTNQDDDRAINAC
jgi:hypothetical protein